MSSHTEHEPPVFAPALYYRLVRLKIQELLGESISTEKHEPHGDCSKAITEIYLVNSDDAASLLRLPIDKKVEENLDKQIRVRKIYDFQGVVQNYQSSMLQHALMECICYRQLLANTNIVLPVNFSYQYQGTEVQNITIENLVSFLEALNPTTFPERVILDMPFGISLKELIEYYSENGGTFKNLAWENFALDLFQAMDIMAEAGVGHFDIKPSNIVYRATSTGSRNQEPNVVPYLIDFDVSAIDIHNNAPSPREILDLTPGFASPEIVQGEVPTPYSDYFSMCRTVLCSMFGERLFKQLINDESEYDEDSEYSEQLKQILKQCRCQDNALIRTLLIGTNLAATDRSKIPNGTFEQNYTHIRSFLQKKGDSEQSEHYQVSDPVPTSWKKIRLTAAIIAAIAMLIGISVYALQQRPPITEGSSLFTPDNYTSTSATGMSVPEMTTISSKNTGNTNTTTTLSTSDTLMPTETSESLHTTASVRTVSTSEESIETVISTPPRTTPFSNTIATHTHGSTAISTTATSEQSDFSYTEYDDHCIIHGFSNVQSNMVIPATLNGKPVTEISNNAFAGNTVLKVISIPASIDNIQSNAFQNCCNLEAVYFDSRTSPISLGQYAFGGCTKLKQFTMTASIQNIGKYCFYESGLSEITIEPGITHIPSHAFAGCKQLQAIYIPDGVTTINEFAFYDCPQLCHIRLPESIMSIGDYAFRAEGGVTKILYYPGTLDTWEQNNYTSSPERINSIFGVVNETPNCNCFDSYEEFMQYYQ